MNSSANIKQKLKPVLKKQATKHIWSSCFSWESLSMRSGPTSQVIFLLSYFNNIGYARLHDTRSELKPVWGFTSGQNFTSVWGNFIISVHMLRAQLNSLGTNFTSVKLTEVKFQTAVSIPCKLWNLVKSSRIESLKLITSAHVLC